MIARDINFFTDNQHYEKRKERRKITITENSLKTRTRLSCTNWNYILFPAFVTQRAVWQDKDTMQ